MTVPIVVNVRDILRRVGDIHITERLDTEGKAPEPWSYLQGALDGSLALAEALRESGVQLVFDDKIDVADVRAEAERITQ